MAVETHPDPLPADVQYEMDLLRSKAAGLTGGMWTGIVVAFVSLIIALFALVGVHRRSAEIADLKTRLATADSLLHATSLAATQAQSQIQSLMGDQRHLTAALASLEARNRSLATRLLHVGAQAGRADSVSAALAHDTSLAAITNQLDQRLAAQTARIDSVQTVALAAQNDLKQSGDLRQTQLNRQAAQIDGVTSDLTKFRTHQVAWDALSLVTHVVALVKR